MASSLRGRRGSLLVISLVILLALSSISLIMVNKVTLQQSYVGNERRGAVAYHVTESGAYTSLAYADSLGPSGLMTELDTLIGPAGEAPTFEPSRFLPAGVDYFDMSKSGSFGYEGFVQTQDAVADPTLGSPVEFKVRVTPVGMLQPLMGYSATGPGSRCRFKYRFDTDGNLRAGDVDDFRAWKRIRALMYVGPLPCTKAAGTS